MDHSTAEPRSNTASDPPAVDGSLDDKPLGKLKTIFVPPKKLKENTGSKSNGTNQKKAGDDSDHEPLTKIAKVSSEAVKKSPKESVHDTKEESEEGDGSPDDDEPLSETAEKLKPQPGRRSAGKFRRPAAKNKVRYAETSSSSSDDETLASKKTNVPQRRKTSAKKETTKQKESEEEERSSDDEEPLGEIGKKLKLQSRRRSAGKTTPVGRSRRAAAMNKDKYVKTSTKSSDDDYEPVAATKTRKTSGNKKTPTKQKEKPSQEASDEDDGSDNDDEVQEKKAAKEKKKEPTTKHAEKALEESSNSSDGDEPMEAIKAKVSTNKKTDKAQKGKHVDSSDDEEPLTSLPTKKTNNSKKQKPEKTTTKRAEKQLKAESQDDGSSSNDETLRETATKLRSKPRRKSAVKPTPAVTKSRRTAAMNKVKYAETSSDDSDDKPLNSRRTKKTNVTKKTSTKEKTTKRTNKVKNSSLDEDEEDDEPLTKAVGRALNKRRAEPSDGSSDYEPLTKQVRKGRTQKQTKTKAPAPKKTNATSRKPRGRPVKGKNASDSSISSQSDDDASFAGAVKHPQVTKMLQVTLERCDRGDAARPPAGGTDGAPTAEKLSGELAPE